MALNSPLYPHVGRKTPAKGVRFSFSGPNILWLTLCAKDRGQWITQKQVMDLLHQVWLQEATAWLVGAIAQDIVGDLRQFCEDKAAGKDDWAYVDALMMRQKLNGL